jgi:hypothetical protein
MPAIAHIGVGFAAKRIDPRIPVIYLIIAAELIELIFFIFVATGIESMPGADKSPFAPYSHGITMGIIWSVLAGVITFLVSRNKKTSILIGILVFSHTILDFIASPKLAFYPTDAGLPVFFSNSLTVGSGLFKYKTLALVIEFGILIIGVAIYFLTIRQERIQNAKSPGQNPSSIQ